MSRSPSTSSPTATSKAVSEATPVVARAVWADPLVGFVAPVSAKELGCVRTAVALFGEEVVVDVVVDVLGMLVVVVEVEVVEVVVVEVVVVVVVVVVEVDVVVVTSVGHSGNSPSNG
jgi:hypothetical protein